MTQVAMEIVVAKIVALMAHKPEVKCGRDAPHPPHPICGMAVENFHSPGSCQVPQ
jgi:hypothetical protein